MASSLGYVLMNWASEFAKHSKGRKTKKNFATNKENIDPTNKSNAIETNDIAKRVSNYELRKASLNKVEIEVQTDDAHCQRCEAYAGDVEFLEHQLSDVNVIQESLKQKLSKTKATLVVTIERETRLRNVQESLELEEAQVRYELEEIKASLAKQLEERDNAHSERIQLMEQVMNAKDCEWAKKNELLQKELRNTLRSALQDTEIEEHSLTSLEQEIDSLRSVIELRSAENRQLQCTNEKLAERIEHHAWLETELEKAKHRLEELSLIVQNKMVSERELLELSEALQRDLVQSRAEALHYKQQIENRQYLQDNNEKNLQMLHKVKHSQPDLFNNQMPALVQPQTSITMSSKLSTGIIGQHIINNDISKQSTFFTEKPSNLQHLKNWVNEDNANEKESDLSGKVIGKNVDNYCVDTNDLNETSSQLEHRNQHQKLW